MRNRLLDVLAIAGFCVLSGVAVTAASSTAEEYEISIYAAYSSWFWMGIVVSFVLGATIVVRSSEGPHRRRYLALGVGLVLLTNAILLFLPIIRGYYVFGGGDMYTHLGHITEIVENGHVNDENYYPGIHVHTLIVMQISGLDFYAVKNVLAPLFSVAYWLGVVVFGLRLTDDSRGVRYLVPFALLPVFKQAELYYGPNMFTFALYPLALYAVLGVRSSRSRFVALLSLVFCYFVFTHPVTTLVGLFTIALIAVSKLATATVHGDRPPVKQSVPLVTVPVAVVVMFVYWYYSFPKILLMTTGMIWSLFFGVETSQLGEYSNALENVPLALGDLVAVVAYGRGSEILLSVGGSVVVLYLGYRIAFGRSRLRWQYVFVVAGFGVFSALAAALLVNPIMLTWTRLFKYAQFFAVLLLAMALYVSVHRSERSVGRRDLAVVAVLLVLTSLVVFGFYDSPLQRGTNNHVPETRLEGMEWFVDHREEGRLAHGFSYRYEHAFLGIDPDPRTGTGVAVPEQLGYGNASSFATPNRTGRYLLVTERLEEYYPSIHPDYPEFWKYGPEDFRRLDRDEGLNRVYANGGLRVYRASSRPVATPVNATEPGPEREPEPQTIRETTPSRRGGLRWSGG